MSQFKRRNVMHLGKLSGLRPLRWLAAVGCGAAALLLGAIFFHHPAVRAADGAAAGGPASQIEGFWNDWQNNKPSVAIRRIAPNADFAQKWEAMGRLAEEFQIRWGRCSGHSLITRKTLGAKMEYDSFYALYDYTPLRVQTLWYDGSGQWKLIALRIDSDPTRWMEEVAPTPTSITVEQNLNNANDQLPPEPPQQ